MKKHVSKGNNKLPKSTAIFNITSATNCPSRKLGLCQLKSSTKCYALKAERQYKQVLPYRKRQAKIWEHIDAKTFAWNILALNKRPKTVRLNESGDFRHQKDVDKAIEIAEILKPYKITVYCYTARKDLNFKERKNLVVNGSGFMVDNNFSVTAKGGYECKADCSKCNVCTVKGHKTIFVKMH